MTAQDYGVTFPYGATSAPYSPGSPHRGNDRPTPSGTPVVIGGVTIGLTGATGLVTGPHLHTQAGPDPKAQQTVNPGPYEFKPGTVVETGTASQWGNYVIVRVGTHHIVYAHLSQINVSQGKVLGGDMEQINLDTARILASQCWARDGYDGRPNAHSGASDDDLKRNHVGKPLTNKYLRDNWFVAAEASKAFAIKAALYKERDALRKQLEAIKPGEAEAKLKAIKDALGIK